MDDLIGIIVALFAVGSWLLGFFNKNEDQNKNRQPKKVSQPRPTPTPSGRAEMRRDIQPVESNEEVPEESSQTGTKSFYEQKKDQLDRLKDQLDQSSSNQTNETKKDSITQGGSIDQKQKKSTERKERLSIDDKLTKKGLAESIIMAEVLGPPRALNPHRNASRRHK